MELISTLPEKKAFLQTHGFDEVTGKNSLLNKYPENEENFNQWGLRDRLFFQEAYDGFILQSELERPFAMFVLTLDTHAPGFPDPVCSQRYSQIKNNRMLDPLPCSTQAISDFIEKIRNSAYSKQTVIVVMSDHLAHLNPAHDYLQKKERKLMFMINMPSGNHVEVTNPGTHYDIGPTVLKTLGFDNHQAYGFGHNMLVSTTDESSFETRAGLLPQKFGRNSVGNIAKNQQIKSYVRTKWGAHLGQITDNGIWVDDTNYMIKIGDKQFSFRHPHPSRTSQSGALLFLLDRDDYRIKNITSLKDFIRLPDEFSIEHWLTSKEGVYLYVGNKSSLSFLELEEGEEENVIVFIDLAHMSGSVKPINGNLSLSLPAISAFLQENYVTFVSSNHQADTASVTEEEYGISLLSCLNKTCQSHIEDARHRIHKAKWGLNVWQIANTGKVKRLAHINHCRERESFKSSPDFKELVQSAKQSNQAKVVLIGHDSVFCDPKKDIIQWFQPFSLGKLKNIKFKQPYIGIIDLRDNTIEEYVGEEFIQATL